MPIRLALVVAVLAALTLALTGMFSVMIVGLVRELPPEFALCLGMLPANTNQCLGAVVTAALARWVYDVHAKIALDVGGGSLI